MSHFEELLWISMLLCFSRLCFSLTLLFWFIFLCVTKHFNCTTEFQLRVVHLHVNKLPLFVSCIPIHSLPLPVELRLSGFQWFGGHFIEQIWPLKGGKEKQHWKSKTCTNLQLFYRHIWFSWQRIQWSRWQTAHIDSTCDVSRRTWSPWKSHMGIFLSVCLQGFCLAMWPVLIRNQTGKTSRSEPEKENSLPHMKEQREMHACGRARRRYLHWVWEKWDAYLKPNDLHTDAQRTERQQETTCAAMTLKARFTQEPVTQVTNAYSVTLVCIAVWSLAGFRPDLARLWRRSDSLSTGSLAPCDLAQTLHTVQEAGWKTGCRLAAQHSVCNCRAFHF